MTFTRAWPEAISECFSAISIWAEVEDADVGRRRRVAAERGRGGEIDNGVRKQRRWRALEG